jgi:hypothetical protein
VLAEDRRILNDGGGGWRREEKDVVKLRVGIAAVRIGASAQSIAPEREEPP